MLVVVMWCADVDGPRPPKSLHLYYMLLHFPIVSILTQVLIGESACMVMRYWYGGGQGLGLC